jgi:Protein of unknown function (DUF2433)
MYSPLIPSAQRQHLLSPENSLATIRQTLTISMLSEFPLLLSGQIKLQVPVFTISGACEDILLLEKLRTGAYDIENLHLLDEATTRCLDIGGIKLRLLGLGGAYVPHKMFDNGEGNATIAGGNGTIWTTALQIGELVDTAQRVYDPTETRLLVTHASPGREGILTSLGLFLKADLTVSAGLHFRYASSWNEFSVQADYDAFRSKLRTGKDAFYRVWDTVKSQVNTVIDDQQRVLLDKALAVVDRVPLAIGHPAPGGGPPATEDPAWKNCWNWNLCDAAYGSLVLDIKEGRVSAELKSQGTVPIPTSCPCSYGCLKALTMPIVVLQHQLLSPRQRPSNLHCHPKRRHPIALTRCRPQPLLRIRSRYRRLMRYHPHKLLRPLQSQDLAKRHRLLLN